MHPNCPTNMSPDWIARVLAGNPWAVLEDNCLRTPPLRIGFPHLDKPQAAQEDDGADKYTVSGLLQEAGSDGPLKDACAKAGFAEWGEQFGNFVSQPNFHKPFKDQGEKTQYEGFVAGLPYFTASGQRKPSFVMQNMAPYTGLIYPGLWAFLIVRPFTYNRMNKQGVVVKRGIGVGLQSLMFICDDKEFGGSTVDVNKAFAGVKIEAGVNPAAAFGQTPQTTGAPASPANVFG